MPVWLYIHEHAAPLCFSEIHSLFCFSCKRSAFPALFCFAGGCAVAAVVAHIVAVVVAVDTVDAGVGDAVDIAKCSA